MPANKKHQNIGVLFEAIPFSKRKPEQVPYWNHGANPPTMKLERDPVNLEELNSCGHGIAIWRENGTLTYLTPDGSNDLPSAQQRLLSVVYFHGGPILNIRGRSEKAVAETAAYFMSLEEPAEESSHIMVGCAHGDRFDFRGAQTQCLQHILEVGPLRNVEFRNVTLSAAQSAILAARPGPALSIFDKCRFDDQGTAFIDALENRKTPIGQLSFVKESALNDDNIKRLLQLDTIDGLGLPELSEELALLPFSAKVDHLDYDIATSSLAQVDLQSLNIVPTKLSLIIFHPNRHFPTLLIHFFKRLENLGHLEEFKVRFQFEGDDAHFPRFVPYMMVTTMMANRNLRVLDLCTDEEHLEWDYHVETLLEGLKDHPALRTLKLNVYMEAFGPDCIHLQRLLLRNQNITVVTENDEIYTDDFVIDELYSVNHFFRSSAALAVEPTPERASLVSNALTEIASKDFRRSGIILSHHIEVLYDFVQGAELE